MNNSKKKSILKYFYLLAISPKFFRGYAKEKNEVEVEGN